MKQYKDFAKGRLTVFILPLVVIGFALIITGIIIFGILKKDYWNMLYAFAYILPILVFCIRKYLFAKIIIDESGVALMYKEEEMKRIKWGELAKVSFSGIIEFQKSHGKECSHIIRYVTKPKLLTELGQVLKQYRGKFHNAEVNVADDMLEYFNGGAT